MATVKTVKKLSGNYFNFADVKHFIILQGKFSLESLLHNACNRVKFKGVEYVTYEEAQTFIIPSLFQKLRTEITMLIAI